MVEWATGLGSPFQVLMVSLRIMLSGKREAGGRKDPERARPLPNLCSPPDVHDSCLVSRLEDVAVRPRRRQGQGEQ